MKHSVLIFLAVLGGTQARAADLQWSGKYRIEGNYIKNYTLDKNQGVEDSYLIHHLIMEPKIIATDGVTIKSRFDIFNNALGNNQAGQIFGDYTGTPTTSNGTQPNSPAVLSNVEQSETIAVNELYVNWVNEFGALIAGRVPFQFGLGMTYNSGTGNFDHFLSNKDLVGYKLVLGNITIMPAYGKVREGFLTNEDDINDYLIVADYTNPETDFSIGFMFDQRVAPADQYNASSGTSGNAGQGNDFPTTYFSNVNSSFGAAQVYDGFSAYNMNFYVKKKTDNFNVGVELGFMNGYSGVKVQNNATGNLDRAEIGGFGGAAEFGYRAGAVKFNLHTGIASGDDPDTARIEGYAFSPNYHVAMMMFNYPMGQYDVLRSGLYGTHPGYSSNPALKALGGLDTETITNAVYFSPNVIWSLGDRYDISGTLAYGAELKSPVSSTNTPLGLSGNIGSSLGFETDLGFAFHPNDKFTWETTLGLFFPGAAFAGPAGYQTNFAYGATSKAAINF